MGKAKDDWIDHQQQEAVAAALGIASDVLGGHPYQMGPTPEGSLFDDRILWDSDAPPGIQAEMDGEQLFTDIVYIDEPAAPEG